MPFNIISVIGLGYIGLPTAAMFASRKINVYGVDINPKVVDTINASNIHIVEPDLDILVKSAVNEGYLTATTFPKPADVFFIAVPTPFLAASCSGFALLRAYEQSSHTTPSTICHFELSVTD